MIYLIPCVSKYSTCGCQCVPFLLAKFHPFVAEIITNDHLSQGNNDRV